MGRPGMAEKKKNPMTHRGGYRRVRRPDPGLSSGGWPGNFTGEVASPSSSSWPARVQGGWPESPPMTKTRLA